MSDLISIIMPTYNRAHVVGDAIASVLAQKYQRWELLVIDDGSSDDTERVIREFRSDSRIKYFAGQRTGVSAARNRGLSVSRGEVIAYLDSDNIWYADYLRAVAALYAAKPETACAYAALRIENPPAKEREILWKEFDRSKLIEENYIDLNVFSHKRALFEELGGFDARMTRVVDWDLILKFTDKYAPVEIPVIGTLYRNHEPLRITTTEPYEPNLAIVRGKWGG